MEQESNHVGGNTPDESLTEGKEELQGVILSHPEVQDAVVIDITNEDNTDQIGAFVVRKGDIIETDLASFINQKIPSYKQTTGGIQFLEKIPRDERGKVIISELKERVLDGSGSGIETTKKIEGNNILRSKYPDVEIPSDMSWSEYVTQHFEEYGDRLAITDVDRQRCYTYSDLLNLIKQSCSGLIKAGLQKDDVLGMYCPNIPEYPIIYLAVLQAGGVVTTANPLYTEDELGHQLQIANAKFLVTIPPLAHRAKECAKNVGISKVFVIGKTADCLPISELFEDDSSMYEKVNILPKSQTALLPFSSGTTGLPKGVLLTHYNLIADACIMTAEGFVEYSTSSVILGLLPFFHSFGLISVLSVGLYRGSTVVCLPKFEREKFLFVLQMHKITHVALVPPVAMMIAKSTTLQTYDLSSLLEITSGAAPLAKEVAKRVSTKIPQIKALRQGYGMTELSPVSHMTVNTNTTHGTVGHLLPNLECKVIDISTGEAVGAGKDGEICVRGPTVMKGYLNNAEATKNCIDEEGWLRTGDVGHYDQDECFYIVDRIKELIKYKGYQVPPAELEDLLVSHPNISDAAVIGIPDDEAGQLPRAYLVTNGSVNKSDIIRFVEESVAPYKKLSGGLEFVDVIPRSSSGKVLRRELRDLFILKEDDPDQVGTITRSPAVTKTHDPSLVSSPAVTPVRNSSCCMIL